MKLDNQQKIQSYVAGLFDAEGWFSFHCQKNKYWNPDVGFINTNSDLIDFYREFLEENSIKYYTIVRRRKSWHKIQTTIMIEGDPQVRKWLNLIKEKLVIKRKQAEVIEESLKIEPKNRGKFRQEFQELLKNEINSFYEISEEWLMGFWEGDGGAYIVRRNCSNSKILLTPSIRFFNTSTTGMDSIKYFLEKEKIPYYVQRHTKNRNKPKYTVSMIGLKRCLKFTDRFGHLDLSGKISVMKKYCERRINLPGKTPYSDLDLFFYERLKILND